MADDIAITDPCVVFALRRESVFFRRTSPYQQRFPGAPCQAQFRGLPSQTVLMLETGLGAAAMESALRWCLESPRFGDVPYRPRFVFSAGFSGALQPELRVGDLVLGSEAIDSEGDSWAVPLSEQMAIREDVIRGRLLTVTQVVGDPREKQRLGEHYGALAVDMESAVVARLCHEYGVPFACLRVISDDINTLLSPHLVDLLRRGRASPIRLLGSVLRHPMMIGELWRLARQTRVAAGRFSLIGPLLEMLER
jgi:adenosylhomocysteine nucleosidase